MDSVKIKHNGNKQSIDLPEKYKFDENELYIKKVGNSLVIFPKKISLDSWFKNLYNFSNDFLNERIQPEFDKRKNL